MGRLIDADAFEEFIKRKYKDGESTDDIKDQMLFDLSYQPTAFNVEAAVEELVDTFGDDICDIDGGFECYTDIPCDECKRNRMRELLRRGGAEC